MKSTIICCLFMLKLNNELKTYYFCYSITAKKSPRCLSKHRITVKARQQRYFEAIYTINTQ